MRYASFKDDKADETQTKKAAGTWGGFLRDKRGLTETADKLARALHLSLSKPMWRETNHGWTLSIGGKVVAEVERNDYGEWRWQRFTTLAEHGLPPAGRKSTSRCDAQKKAWPK